MRFLPRTMLQEIGRTTATWSAIEQNLLIQASAMHARDTDGWPTEYLRMDFKRLREKWWAQVAVRYPKRDVDRVFNPLNSRLADASKTRGYMMHGKWNVDSPGVYSLEWWEQKSMLNRYSMTVTLSQMRAFNQSLDALFRDLLAATTEQEPASA